MMDPIPMEIKSSQETPNFERSSRVYYDERPNQPGPLIRVAIKNHVYGISVNEAV